MILGLTPTNNSFEMSLNEFIAHFNACSQNRKVNQAKVLKIAKSIIETGIFMPVAVNKNTMCLVDGHHRVAAAKYINEVLGVEMKIPFFFVTPNVSEFEALLAINNIDWNWTSRNYGESAFETSSEYRDICQFARDFKLVKAKTNAPKLRIVSAYIGKNVEQILRSGKYSDLAISSAEWKHIRVDAASITKMMRVMKVAQRTNNIAAFAAAWRIFRKDSAFKSLVISQKGEIAAMAYIANNFDWAFAINKTRFLQGFAKAAK
jgi:hypothetical protein